MADSTQIEWTDSTWNPVTGCSKVSAGCDFCYAERFSERFRGVRSHPFESGFDLTIRLGKADTASAMATSTPYLRQFDERSLS